jgi:hypothetical protein
MMTVLVDEMVEYHSSLSLVRDIVTVPGRVGQVVDIGQWDLKYSRRLDLEKISCDG